MINATLKKLIPQNTPISAPTLYSVLAPAKRIRPFIVLATTKMLGVSEKSALHPACALEFIHTSSLIHDDLPCMDDDDFRRGKPTLHKAYDEATAVLAGDYLLSLAFETIADAPNLSTQVRLNLTRILAKRTGAFGMIGGQVLDLQKSTDITTLNALKTAALFEAAMEFAEAIAEVSNPNLSAFGLQFGLLFQAIDDIQDNDHPLGPAKAHEAANDAYCQCKQLLLSLPYDSSELDEKVEMLASHINLPV